MKSGNLESVSLSPGVVTAFAEPNAGVDTKRACSRSSGDDRRAEVCHRWLCQADDGIEAAVFHGDVSSCSPGDLDADAAERALRIVNLHRFLADVPTIVEEPAWTGAAQQCALLAHANSKLSHTPSSDWKCWSDLASKTSAVSLIANRSVPPAIFAFMEDPGNESTMVHRRWLLSEEIWRVGLGSTDRYSCVVVDGRELGTGLVRPESEAPRKRGWVAWPPAGPVPIDIFTVERLDEMGWTIQSSSDDLDDATVTVSSGGRTLSVHVTHLEAFEGSHSAIRLLPDGWRTEAGHTYDVSVRGKVAIDFTVEPDDCS